MYVLGQETCVCWLALSQRILCLVTATKGCPIASTSQHQLRSKKAQMRTHVYSKRDIFVRVFSGDDRPRGDC